MRQIAQRLVFDFAVFAVTAPEQVGAIDPIFVLADGSDDVSCTGALCHIRIYSTIHRTFQHI